MTMSDTDLEFMSELTLSIEGASFDAGSEIECLHRESECSTILDDNEHIARLHGELKKYLELLPHTVTSLNALLDAEHNSTDEKALSLLQYYEERPNLLDYTLEKELPRMDYTWIDEKTGEFITDKSRIAILLWEASLSEDPAKAILPRCANQSLLADLLHFLTTESGNALIRTQFHMAVDTRKVTITIMPSNKTVLVKSTLGLSLPHPARGLVNIGTVDVSAQFSPLAPMFHYHVESVEVVEPCPDDDELLEMVIFLQDLPSFFIEEEEPLGNRPSSRDVFLQRTHTAWKHSSGLAQKLLNTMSSAPRTDNGGEQAPQQQRQCPANQPAPLRGSLRRIRDAQKASSKKIMTRLKTATSPSVFKKHAPPSPSEPHQKNTWGQVSSRLLNKKQSHHPPKSPHNPPHQEKWSGMFRPRWGRKSNSLSSPSSQDGSECLVFDDAHDDSPTEPPSDDEERTRLASPLFGPSKTFSTANSPMCCDHSTSSDDEVLLDLGELVDDRPELWDCDDSSSNNTVNTVAESQQPEPASQNDSTSLLEENKKTVVAMESAPTPNTIKESSEPPIAWEPEPIPVGIKENSEPPIAGEPEPIPADIKENYEPPIAGEPEPIPADIKENSEPDIAERPEPIPANIKENSEPDIAEEPEPIPADIKENLEPPIAGEPEPIPANIEENSQPDFAAEMEPTPTATREYSVSSPIITAEIALGSTLLKESKELPTPTPSKGSNIRSSPFGSKRWQNPRRFLTKLMQ